MIAGNCKPRRCPCSSALPLPLLPSPDFGKGGGWGPIVQRRSPLAGSESLVLPPMVDAPGNLDGLPSERGSGYETSAPTPLPLAPFPRFGGRAGDGGELRSHLADQAAKALSSSATARARTSLTKLGSEYGTATRRVRPPPPGILHC